MVTLQRLGEISGRLQLVFMLLILWSWRQGVFLVMLLATANQGACPQLECTQKTQHDASQTSTFPKGKQSSNHPFSRAMLNFGSVLWFIYCVDSKSMSAWELQKKHPFCWFVATKISQKMSICVNSFNDFMLLLHRPTSWNNVIWGKQCRIRWTTFVPLAVFSHLAFNTWHMTHHV